MEENKLFFKIENLEKGNGVFKFYGKTRNRYEEFDLLEE